MVVLCANVLPAADRVVAVGDVHGSYDSLLAILTETGLVDSELLWAGGEATLVQTGDLLDRGSQLVEVMDLLMRLQTEAHAAGGRVIVLLGNHEAMNILGIHRDVNPEAYADFTDKRSEKRRKAAFRQFKKFWNRRSVVKGEHDFSAVEAQWFDAHPLGSLEYVEAMSGDGVYGAWLRSCPVAVLIDGSLFVHGGAGPAVRGKTVEEVNLEVAEEFAAFDVVRSWAVEEKLTLPTASVYELAQVAEVVHQAMELGNELVVDLPDELVPWLDKVRGWQSWYSIDTDGPLWFRGAAMWEDEEKVALLLEVLDEMGAERLVVGHTPQRTGEIHVRFGGRVFLIDTGMLVQVYRGQPAALEIIGGTVSAVYPGERVSLFEAGQ